MKKFRYHNEDMKNLEFEVTEFVELECLFEQSDSMVVRPPSMCGIIICGSGS